MIKLEHIYRWPTLPPASVHRMDNRYAIALNQLKFAIRDVRKDIERLDKEMTA